MHRNVWDEIIYAFPSFNGAAVEAWEWISNFIPHFTGHVITYAVNIVTVNSTFQNDAHGLRFVMI